MSPERAHHGPVRLVSQVRNVPLEEVAVDKGPRGKSVRERGCSKKFVVKQLVLGIRNLFTRKVLLWSTLK